MMKLKFPVQTAGANPKPGQPHNHRMKLGMNEHDQEQVGRQLVEHPTNQGSHTIRLQAAGASQMGATQATVET